MSAIFRLVVIGLALASAVSGVGADEPAKTGKPRSRTFLFTYAATVTDLEPGTKARVWLPIPPSTSEQDVKIESKELPAPGKIGKEAEYGNEILYVEAVADKDGKIPLKIVYRVTRREVQDEKRELTEDEKQIARFLQADALVPIGGKSLELVKNRKVPENQVAAARIFYEVVNGHMRYSKEGEGWGRGDSDWACDSKYGNCTDSTACSSRWHGPARFLPNSRSASRCQPGPAVAKSPATTAGPGSSPMARAGFPWISPRRTRPRTRKPPNTISAT